MRRRHWRFGVLGWPLVALALSVSACGDGTDEVGAGGASGSDGEPAEAEADADEPVTPIDVVAYSDEELIPLCLEDVDDTAPAPDTPGILFGADGFGYCVGPALFVDVESAEVVGADGLDPQLGPTVQPVFTDAGISAFNQLAGECFQPPGGPTPCPTSQIAIVVDGVVVSAPSIQAPAFARDQIVIAGGFTPTRAEDLAVALAADGLLEVRPVLLLLGPPGDG